jgi:hypothetical protein
MRTTELRSNAPAAFYEFFTVGHPVSDRDFIPTAAMSVDCNTPADRLSLVP